MLLYFVYMVFAADLSLCSLWNHRLAVFDERVVSPRAIASHVSPGWGNVTVASSGKLNLANEVVEGVLLAKSEFLAKAVAGGVDGGGGDSEHTGNLLGAHAYAQVCA